METKKTKSTIFLSNVSKTFAAALLVCFVNLLINAQSTNQGTPTPITTNEINGKIRARDLGDSRLTNYFYAFDGNQGDVFVNIVTENLDGDIDIFTVDGLKPLTKVRIFSDVADGETGRVVYLRKPEKLLLRIQGRSPNDDPASFKIKFAGSFQPLQNLAETEELKQPEIEVKDRGGIRVNSVGTIIKTEPEPTLETKEVAEEKNPQSEVAEKEDSTIKNKEINVKSVEEKTMAESSVRIEIRREKIAEVVEKSEPEIPSKTTEDSVNAEESKTEVLAVKEDTKAAESVAVPADNLNSEMKNTDDKVVAETNQKLEVSEDNSASNKGESNPNAVRPLKSDELKNIALIVKFKDGKTLNQAMSKVFSFNVNQGILTIISYDGKVSRYSLLDIEKISIEGNSQP